MAKRSILKTVLVIFLILLFVCIGVLGAGYFLAFSPNVKNLEKPKYFYVYPEDDIEKVVGGIEKMGVLKHPSTLRMLSSMFLEKDATIFSGRYELKPGEYNFNILKKVIHGRQSPIRISFNNSIRTKDKLAEKLTANLMISKEEFLSVLDSEETYKKYGLKEETIISLFLPNTYEVYWNVSAEKLIERMKQEYDKFWTEERKAKLDGLGLSQTEVSTLASIVESETLKSDEKPMVAGLYLNRLRIGMLLQADPTVIFGLQDFSIRRVTGEHLASTSPYNTYKYLGLPPGPIRVASGQGIDAVLNYKKHDYIYMCAKEDFSGYHNFAATYTQHQENAERYRRKLNRIGVK